MDQIINYTPTGMIPTKAMTPHVPITVNEIIDDVRQACELGITIVHLHARDEEGKPTTDSSVYGRIIEGIKTYAPDLVICVSLSGRLQGELEKRIQPLQQPIYLMPDMGSLTLSSLNFAQQASVNAPQTIIGLATEMKKRSVIPEFEVFDVGMVNYMKYVIKKLNMTPPFYVNILVGNIASSQLDLVHIGSMLHDLPTGSIWTLAGIGATQYPANMLAIALGGGVRIGLEDNIFFDSEKTVLATNQNLLERIHKIIATSGRTVMKPLEFRKLMGMRK